MACTQMKKKKENLLKSKGNNKGDTAVHFLC